MGQLSGTPTFKRTSTEYRKSRNGQPASSNKDYRSREAGSMTAMLEELGLPSLEARRKENRLCLLYKISNNLVPAIPSTDLTPMRNKRKITGKRFGDCEATNFVTRHQNLHDKCYNLPTTNSTTYKNSYFPRTIGECNQLKETSYPSVGVFRKNFNKSLRLVQTKNHC